MNARRGDQKQPDSETLSHTNLPPVHGRWLMT